MNPTGKTKKPVLSIRDKEVIRERIGQTPVQFSVTVEQLCTMFGATKIAYDKTKEWEAEGFTETAILMELTRKFPMSTLRRVIMRDKIKRFINLREEIRNARNQTD